MNGNDITISRAHIISEYLLKNIGKEVPIPTLMAELHRQRGDSIGNEAVRQVAFYLKNYMCPRGYEVKVSKKGEGSVTLNRIELPLYLKRTFDLPEIKTGIGSVFWDWLLHIQLDPDFKATASHQETVKQKLSVLRSQSVLSMIVDAGSANYVTVHSLLEVDSIPIQPKSPVEGQCQFITPTIITNSLPIATLVAESKHAEKLELRLIGGSFKANLSSICGTMTELGLQAWGGWKCDLAIIGTTGCWAHPSGTLGFSCDAFEEARLKAQLLSMGYFRTIIMDSSKLAGPPAGNLFAPLSSTTVDLVVLDDGRKLGNQIEVQKFRRMADQAGVAVLVLETALPPAEKPEPPVPQVVRA